MVLSDRLRRMFAGPDVLAAVAAIAGFYALAYLVPVQALQLPGYLLVVGFDLFDAAVPSGLYPLGFAAYLYALAVAGAAAVRVVRRRDAATYRSGVGAGFLVLGLLALGLALVVYLPHARIDTTPVLIVASAGVVLLSLAAVVTGVVVIHRGGADDAHTR